MKLKYYLRGLGIGIIVTAVIMGASSGSRKETLSDREIRERAAELGMVEQSGSLAEMAQEENVEIPEETEKTETPTKIPSESPEASEEPAATQTPEATKEAEETPRATATKEPEVTPKATATKEPETTPKASPVKDTTGVKGVVDIEVKSGEGSYSVCRRLEGKGLIDSASDFDTYLCANGYDRKLRVGSYKIPADADPEEIAKILCGMN